MQRREFCRTGWQALIGGATAYAGSGAVAAAEVTSRSTSSGAGKIKIGQIGTGHAHAAGKLEAVRRLSDTFELVGIAEADDGLRSRAENSPAYSGLSWLGEDELLAVPGLAAVVVETRMERSASVATKAVAAGKHVHLDKPGALKHEDFRAFRTAAERRGLTVQMGYMLRYNPAFKLLFTAVREGWFGDVLEIDCSMGKLANAGMRRELAALPGGGMLELACHLVDAVVTVLGRPEKVHALGKQSDTGDSALADNQLAVFEYPRATATIRCNHADPFGGPHRRFQVVGSRGGIEIDPLESCRGRIWLSEPHGGFKKGEQTFALDPPPGRYDWEFVDLAEVIRGRKPLAWNAAHDVAVHESVLRAAGIWENA